MGADEKRGALRVPCTYSVRIVQEEDEVIARLEDVSRTGLAFRLPVDALPELEADNLSAQVMAVHETLGDQITLDLHYEVLGPLVRKQVAIVRISQAPGDEPVLRVAGHFACPLTDDEVVVLGVGLPAIGVTDRAAFRDLPTPRQRGVAESQQPAKVRPGDYDCVLHPAGGMPGAPVSGYTAGRQGESALLRFDHGAFPPPTNQGPAPVIHTLITHFGPQPRLEILDGLRLIWSGPVELVDVDVRRSALYLTFKTGREAPGTR